MFIKRKKYSEAVVYIKSIQQSHLNLIVWPIPLRTSMAVLVPLRRAAHRLYKLQVVTIRRALSQPRCCSSLQGVCDPVLKRDCSSAKNFSQKHLRTGIRLHLINIKCLPILLLATESYKPNKAYITSLDLGCVCGGFYLRIPAPTTSF